MSSRCFKLFRFTAHIKKVSRSTDSASLFIMSVTSRITVSESFSGNCSVASCLRLCMSWVTSEQLRTPSWSKSKILKQTGTKVNKDVSNLVHIWNKINNSFVHFIRSTSGPRQAAEIPHTISLKSKCPSQFSSNAENNPFAMENLESSSSLFEPIGAETNERKSWISNFPFEERFFNCQYFFSRSIISCSSKWVTPDKVW